jgi:hypothetical protein
MEKRKARRFEKHLFVKFGKERPDSTGMTGDLSPVGLFIKTNVIHEPGTELNLEITLPDQRTVRMGVRVAWAKRVPSDLMRFIKKSGMGVILLRPSEEYFQYLKRITEGK